MTPSGIGLRRFWKKSRRPLPLANKQGITPPDPKYRWSRKEPPNSTDSVAHIEALSQHDEQLAFQAADIEIKQEPMSGDEEEYIGTVPLDVALF